MLENSSSEVQVSAVLVKACFPESLFCFGGFFVCYVARLVVKIFSVSGALTREPFLQCLQLLLNGQMSVTESLGIASQFDVCSLFPCQIWAEITAVTVSRKFKLS